MQIFIGQPLTPTGAEIKQKVINNQPVKVIKGKNFTYYVKTENGIVSKVVAHSQRQLAPASYFIQNAEACTKKLLFRVPLRMAVWEYDCPQGKFEYKTFGLIGNMNTEVKVVK